MPRKASVVAPAPYPATDHSESRAINVLNELLKTPCIKSHFGQRDKIPNIDGFIELVDEQSRPMGKFDVQIKYLGNADRRRMAYSCRLQFLAYCQSASLPVILIGVVPEERKAFWIEITRADAARVIKSAKGKSKTTVHFPSENVIEDQSLSYIEEWKRIVSTHRNKLEFHDKHGDEIKRLREIAKSIEEPGLGFRDSEDIDLSEIQIHIDEVNRLLDTSFPVVKKTLFPGAWKIGFAFALYSDRSLAFCHYPIQRGRNDFLIRRVSPKKFASLDFSRTHYPHENPILKDPVGFAREFVRERATEMLDDMALDFDDVVLAREFLFAVVDRLSNQLHLSASLATLKLEAVQFAWNVYLPNWVLYVWNSISADRQNNLLQSASQNGYVDLEALEFLVHSIGGERHSAVAKAVGKQMAANKIFEFTIPVGTRGLPLAHVERLLTGLVQNDVSQLDRLYTVFDFKRNPESRSISSWWTHDQLVDNLRLFFQELPRLFAHVVEKNFPELQKHLDYFDDFNRQIVVVDAPDSPECVGFQYCELRGGTMNRVDVYSYQDGISLLPRVDQTWIELDGTRYEVRRIGSSTAIFMFHPLPLLNWIRDELRSRIKRLSILRREPRPPSSEVSMRKDGIVNITAKHHTAKQRRR